MADRLFGETRLTSDSIRSQKPIRFGDDFEVDFHAYELRRAGRVVKLERIPMEMLLLLIEERPRLVGREEIAERIWGKGVCLDTDNSINGAIRKIRQALRDDPENPGFVQTITGRGYRFIGPVIEPESNAAPPDRVAFAPLQIGSRISHYRLLQLLGGGGMGVVYRAEDLKLGRQVAIKFLPSELMHDERALALIQREARLASALEHSNICPIYELGEHESQPFIVMQLLEGQTLREWISAMPPADSPERFAQIVELAIQIADGLEAAHQRGIIHRDIKPANIFVTKRGEAKILDFGVAKVSDSTETGAEHSHSVPAAEANQALTRTDGTFGTPWYLSPEQVRCEKLDTRTDLFSFGLVLYEIATGQRAFQMSSREEICDAVLHQDVLPASQANPNVPPALDRIINRALKKAREERYQSAAELRADLGSLEQDLDHVQSSPGLDRSNPVDVKASPANSRAVINWSLAGIVLLALGLSLYLLWNRAGTQPYKDFTITQVTTSGKAEQAAISPDGKYVLHVQNENGIRSIRLRNIATGSDTEIFPPTTTRFKSLIFSPDGNYIYFRQLFNSVGSEWDLFRLPVLGGNASSIARDVDSDVAFSPDGQRISYVRANDPVRGMFQILSAKPDGGNETVLSAQKIMGYGEDAYPPFPAWSADGKRLFYSYGKMSDTPGAIRQLELGSNRFSLFQQFSDLVTYEIRWLPKDRWLMLVHAPKQEENGASQISAVSLADGKLHAITRDTNSYSTMTLSADAKTAAAVQSKTAAFLDLLPAENQSSTEDHELRRFENADSFDWTTDGKLLLSDGSKLRRTGATGEGTDLLTDPKAGLLAISSCSNGLVLLNWNYYGGTEGSTIWRINQDGSNPFQLTHGKFDMAPACSPDGKWVYYLDGLQTLLRVPIDGGRPEPVAGSVIENFNRFFGTVSFSPDGASLVILSEVVDPVSGRCQAKTADHPPTGDATKHYAGSRSTNRRRIIARRRRTIQPGRKSDCLCCARSWCCKSLVAAAGWFAGSPGHKLS